MLPSLKANQRRVLTVLPCHFVSESWALNASSWIQWSHPAMQDLYLQYDRRRGIYPKWHWVECSGATSAQPPRVTWLSFQGLEFHVVTKCNFMYRNINIRFTRPTKYICTVYPRPRTLANFWNLRLKKETLNPWVEIKRPHLIYSRKVKIAYRLSLSTATPQCWLGLMVA